MTTVPEEAVKAAMDAFHEAWNNNQGLDNELPVYAHRAALTAALPFLIKRERDLAERQLTDVVDRMSDDYLALKAELDQAVGVIEDRSSEYEALEAKLAAAEKALEPFVSFFNEAMKGFTEGYAERTPSDKPVLGWNNAYLLMQHFIEARATLGGKPS